MKHISFTILAILLTASAVSGQKKKTAAKPKAPEAVKTTADSSDRAFEARINVQAKYFGDSIVLRWAPETPGAWREVNKSGFIISRTTLDENGSFDPATFQPLNAEPLKPWPLEKWASIASQNSKDDFAKIAAQALYGKAFVPSQGFIGQADEFATRFSFAMLAADISPNTSRALGLRFVDRKIEKGKTYIYRVISRADSSRYRIYPGVFVVTADQVQPVPKVAVHEIKEKENLIELHWLREIHDRHFSAYYIERSDDNGKTFHRLTRTPFIHPVSEKNPAKNKDIVYLDSLPQNYKAYHYRVVGITSFGELSPVSDVIKGMGKDKTPPQPPQNVKAKHAGGTRVSITWDYPKSSKDIRGFLIGKGNDPSKQFVPLVTEPLSARTRSYVDENADVMRSNYYIVAAVDTAGNASVSLAQYAMIIDSIPPAPPTGLSGAIDSAGHVTLSWKLGPEQDIQGYLVFFANKADHEFAQLTSGPLQDTVYRDTIQIKTLTKHIYYRVVAIDYNSNYSAFSQILELKRPDVVPPSQAVMDGYKVALKGIELEWVPSSSEDLAKTVLYRWEDDSRKWKEIAAFDAKDKRNHYLDTVGMKSGKLYSYSLVSFDEDGLASKRSVPVKIKFMDFSKREAVNNLQALPNTDSKDITVSWNYPVKGEYRFIIYRAVNGSGFTSYKTFGGTVNSFRDTEVKKGSAYEYSVGVIYKDGVKAPFGKIVKTQM
jgi:fibronectin type 3 domain-containing protein